MFPPSNNITYVNSVVPKRQSGFTLIELVSVIVLLGIVAISTTQFIRQGVGIYVDTVRRDNLQQQGRFAVERVTRELRNALPGSLRVLNDCIEFSPIEAASSYLGNVADFQKTSFDAVDFTYDSVSSRRVAIYTIENRDVYNFNRKAVIDLDSVEDVSSSKRTVNLKNYSGPGHRFRNESPTKRFYIVTEPVSFCIRTNKLYRHDKYGWLKNQSDNTGDIGSGVVLAEHIQTIDSNGNALSVFDFASGTLQRAGVTKLDFQFRDSSEADEWVTFNHEVFVRNSP